MMVYGVFLQRMPLVRIGEVRSFGRKRKALPLVYEEVKLEVGYRIDLLIESKVIVEIKAVEALNDVHTAQVLTYLKLSSCKVGLLLNFNTSSLKNGIKRLVF
jgi:GxxExxY protein